MWTSTIKLNVRCPWVFILIYFLQFMVYGGYFTVMTGAFLIVAIVTVKRSRTTHQRFYDTDCNDGIQLETINKWFLIIEEMEKIRTAFQHRQISTTIRYAWLWLEWRSEWRLAIHCDCYDVTTHVYNYSSVTFPAKDFYVRSI